MCTDGDMLASMPPHACKATAPIGMRNEDNGGDTRVVDDTPNLFAPLAHARAVA